MAASGLVTVGSHTRHHVRMQESLPDEELREEIVMSRDEIQEKCGCPVELFCYPNGDTTEASINLVEQAYLGACTTERGWNFGQVSAYAIRRVPLHEDRSATRDAFLARLVGAI